MITMVAYEAILAIRRNAVYTEINGEETMESIKTALVQLCPVPGETEKNAEKMAGYMRAAKEKNAGLVIFPECCLTGYAPDRADTDALDLSCSLIQGLEELADRLEIAVCFGFAERSAGLDGERFYISQELYCRGERTIYRKTHLGSREEKYFSAAGCESQADAPFPLARIEGIKAGMQLCWESHIPQISAEYRKQGAQLLIFPYASGMSGQVCRDNWSVQLPARASDNGCFAAACNLITAVRPGIRACGQTGRQAAEDPGSQDPQSLRGGGLAVWDPKGRLIAGCFDTREQMLLCDIGGQLPREHWEKMQQGLERPDMHQISYFDKVRTELFKDW